MIVIHGSLLVRAEEVAAVTEAARGFVAEVRAEAGCIAYDLGWDIVEPNRLRLLEHWADDAAYEAHRVQPHVARWAAMIGTVQETRLATTKLRAQPR